MSVQEQGEIIEEEDYGFVDDDEDVGDEDAEYDEESELEIETFFGVPKRIVYIAAAALVVLIIFVAVISMWASGSKKSKADDYDDYDDYDYGYVDNDAPDIVDFDDTADVDVVYDSPEIVDLLPPTIDSIEDTTRETLRGLGWTADEIELTLSYGFDEVAMIDHARELRDKEAAEAWKRMSNQASEEFQGMLYYTYLGQPEVWNPEGNMSDIESTMSNVKINADYVKCPTYGHQLWLKCKIATDTYVFYQCHPARWVTLPDEGNIVLSVDFWNMNGNSYVTGISEADSTLNSIDSSHTYADITDNNPGDGVEDNVEVVDNVEGDM